MRSRIILFILFGFLSSFSLWGQVLNVTLVKKESCSGSNNGSFTITVDNTTTTVGPYAYTIFGVNTSTFKTGSLTLGVPTVIPNLPPDANYIVAVSDGDNAVSNYSSVQSISNITSISSINSTKADNSDQTCLTPNGSINITSVNGGTGSYFYSWTGPGGFTSSAQNISNLQGGTYTVVITDQNANCSFTPPSFVITDPLPSTFTISSPDVFLCTGEDLVIDIHPTTPTNGIQYTLYDGATAVGSTVTWPTSQIVLVGGLTPTGLHSNVRVEGKLAGSICTPIFSTNTLAVQVNTPPTTATLTLAGATPICEGQSSSIQANISGGSAPYSFTVTGLGPVSGYNGSPITVSPVVTTTYSFGSLITDNNGCTVSGTGSFQIVVNPKPTATISGGGPVCASDPLPDVTFTFTGTAPFDFTYSDGATSVNVTGHNSLTYTLPNAPVGTYSVTALKDANTCVATNLGTPVSVSVNPLPTASISGGATVCANALPTITFTFTGTAPFNFTYTDGTTPVTVTAHNSTTFSIPNAPAGNYSVTALSDANGCTATNFGTTQTVIVNPLPTATITGGGPVCANDPLPSVTFTFTGTAPFDFTYTDGVTPVTVTGYGSNSFPIANAPAGTYSITALSDANTCVATNLGTPVSVSVNPLPTASTSGGATVCANALPTITFTFTGTAPFNFTYTDGTTPVTVTANNSTTFSIPNAPAGNYSVTALSDANGCTATNFGTTQTVIVNPLPTATITGGGVVCAGSPQPDVTFTFTGTAPFDFTYADGVNAPVTINGHNSNTYIISAAPVGTYSITALSDANTCAATALGTPVSVSNHVLPTASASGGSTICSGDPLPTITFTFTGTAPFNFTYTDGANPPVSVTGHASSTFTIPNAPAGSYSVTALSDANCTGTSLGSSTDVIVNTAPDVVISGGGVVCPGNPQPDVIFTFSGTAPFDFTYSDGTNPPVNIVGHPTTTFTITAAAVGTYSITAFNDASICPATSFGTPVSVSNQVLPTASASGGSTICSGDPLPTITFTFTGTAPFNFTYTDGANPPVSVTGHASSTFTIPNAPAGSYSVTALSDANCTGTSLGSSTDVIVNTAPDVVISGGGVVCPGNPQPDVIFTFSGTAPFDFTYSDGTNPPVNIVGHPTTTFTITAAAVGTYSITAFNDASICPATSFGTPVSVSNQVLPTASASGGSTICSGDPLPTITFTFTGTAPFNFTYTDGANPPVSVTGHASSTFTIPNAPAGSYSVTALSDANCTGTSLGSSTDVIVNTAPDVVISGGGVVCPGNPQPDVIFTFSGTAPFDFTYSDGTNPPVNIVGHPTTTFTITAAAVGTYSITAFNDASICPATSFGTPVSVSNQVLPTASVSGGGTVCASASLPTVTFTFTGTAPFNFTYTDGTTPVSVTGYASNSFPITNAPAGSYSITALSDANCTGTSFGTSVDVIVEPAPAAPSITFDATPICVGSTITAPVVNAPVGTSTYTWYSDAALTTVLTTGTTPTNAQLGFSSAAAGTTTVYVTETSSNSCAGLPTAVTLTVTDVPTAVISGGGNVCAGVPATLTLTLTGTQPWDVSYTDGVTVFNITGIASSPHSFQVSPATTSTYTLVSVSNSTCGPGTVSGSASVTVTPIGGDEVTPGINSWIGYVYTDASAPAPPVSNIDFASGKYRGFLTQSEIFDLNLGNATPLAGPNICGSYLDDYSIRFRMRKTFTTGSYTFTIGGDDGVRLFLDGVLVTVAPGGSFNTHAYTTYTSGSICLTGPHELVIEYFERGAVSRVNFSYTQVIVDATINPAGPFCSNDVATTLTAVTPNGTWSGSGITNAATGVFDPSVAGAGSHTITYTVTAGGCTDTQTTTIIVNPVPDASITPAGPFCISDAPATLSAATAGGTWSGTGITDASLGTFDPAIAGLGNHTITYSVTAGGCTDTRTTNINVTTPDATITAAGPFCVSDGAATLVAATSGGTWSGAGIISASAGTFDPGTAGVGTHTITYTVTIGGCTDTKTTDIDVIAAPDATITGVGPFCSNDLPVTLSAVTSGGTWSGSGITNAATGAFDPASATIGNNTITYTVTVGGCTDTKTTTIVVNAAPDATITAAGPFCILDPSTTLTAATSGGTWSGTGITNASTGAFDPAIAGVGTFVITYTVTNGTCTDTKTTNLTVANPPDATITAVGPFCSNDLPVTLSAATSGGTWSGSGITNAATGAFDPASATIGSNTITYTMTIGGCTDTKTTTIIVNAAPDAAITAAGPFCVLDATTTLTAATAGGTWSGTGITDTNAGTFDPAIAGVGNYVITYTVNNGTCSDTKTTNITVANPPDATITAAGPFCANDLSVTLTAVTSGGTWSGSGITNAATGTFDPASATIGSNTITYTIAIGGCTDTKTTTIVVNAAPDATITAAGPFCTSDASTTLSAVTSGGTWSGAGITNAATGAFDPSIAGAGTHTITYTVTSGTCTDTKTTTITVATPPDATITTAGPFCSSDAATNLTAATTGGTWSGTGITNAATGTFDPSVAGAGNHTITYSLTIGGCSDTKTTTIVVNAGAGSVSITPVGPVCTTTSPFNLAASVSGGTWSGTGITNPSTGAFSPAVSGTGTFVITYTVGSGTCTATATTNVQVNATCGGVNCFAFTTSVDTNLTKRPSCINGQNDGVIVLNVAGSTPGSYIVTLMIGGTAVFPPQIGPAGSYSFINLSPARYQYKLQDQAGNVCIQDFDLLVQSTVNATASNMVDAKCFGQPTGQARITVNSGGNSPYEYSLDGVLWTSFVSPVTLTNLPPSATPYNVLVRDDASDNCPAEVLVTIGNAFTQIVGNITPQTAATCNNNDGSVLVAYSGGDATGTGYTFELDGTPFTMPADKIIRNLSGGNHILKITDNQLCSITLSGTQFAVASPGLIQFTNVAVANPSCTGNGEDGMITVEFPTGANEVAITQDADRSSPVFKDVPVNGIVEYKNLSKGRYYITVKSKVNGCPNERAIDILGGPSRISFTQQMTCELGSPVLKLSDINVASGPFDIQIVKLGDVTPSVVTLTGTPAGGIYYLRGIELPSATGEYEIKLVQVQGTCTINSAVSRYTNRGALTVNAADILPSFSDIATGSFKLTNFAGGTVPYYASIRFDSAANPVNEVGFETDLEEVDPDPSTFGYTKRYNKLHAGRYHVTVNEEGGCSVEFDVRIPIDYTFSINNIPNVFTPNGDGVNDFFFIRNLPADAQLVISNRWGNEVYSSKSYQNDWNGGSASDGIYYYRLKADGEVVTGWIEIQRGK